MSSTLATAVTIAALATQAMATSCPFPANVANSPCASDSVCHTGGLLHGECQAKIETFCCAGSDFSNFPEITDICDAVHLCDSKTEAERVQLRSTRSSRLLGMASGPDGDDDSCDDLALYGNIFTHLSVLGEDLTDPTAEEAYPLVCDGESPATWTVEIDNVLFPLQSSFLISVDGSTSNIFDCGSSCAVSCENNVNLVTISYTEGDENPTVTCEESTHPLTVYYVSDYGEASWDWEADAHQFDSVGDTQFDFLLEDIDYNGLIEFKLGFGQGSFAAIGCGPNLDEACAFDIEAGHSALIQWDSASGEAPTVTVLEPDVVTNPFGVDTAAPASAAVGAMTVLATLLAVVLM